MSTLAIHPSRARQTPFMPTRNRPTPVRLTARGRFVARLAVVASLSILLLSGASLLTRASAGSDNVAIPTPYVKIAVAPGQTLWSIAQAIEGSGDKRDLVDEIISINHLTSPDLSAGQRIYIPTRH